LAEIGPEKRYPSEETPARRETLDDLDEWGRDIEIRKFSDRYGSADDDPSLDALVVSPETEPVVEKVNRRRAERGMDPLETIVVEHTLADDGKPISSTRIVEAEIDEHGNVL